MALELFENIESEYELTIDNVHLFKSKEYLFDLRGLNWIFRVNKMIDEDGDSLSIDVERIVGGGNDRYSCMAAALVELVPFGVGEETFADQIQPKEFSAQHKKWSLEPYIQWDELVDPQKHLVENNKIQLRVAIRADAKYDANTNPMVKTVDLPSEEQCDLKMRLQFQKIRKVLGAVSQEFLIANIPFRIEFSKYEQYVNNKKENSFSVYLWRSCDGERGKIKLKAKFRLLKSQPEEDGDAYERNTGIAEFNKKDWRFGFNHFVSWDELEEQYIHSDGSAIMEIELNQVMENPNNRKRPIRSDVVCTLCCDSKSETTLLRINCGHLYCKILICILLIFCASFYSYQF